MSENIIPQHQKKQYLLMIDEAGMAVLAQLSPAFAFVQVEGMPIDNKPGYQVLVNPISPKAQEILDMPSMDEL